MSSSDIMRLFIAYELPANRLGQRYRDAMSAIQRAVEHRGTHGTVRWEPAIKLHITLRFIGDYPAEKLPDLENALSQSISEQPPFEMTFGKLQIKSNRMIWLVPSSGLEQLNMLNGRVESAMKSLKLPPSQQFTGHITLARLRPQCHLEALSQVVNAQVFPALPPLTVDRLSIMSSELLPSGSRYTCLNQIAFSS